jgi:sensor c-di-GMP phosphodiesterase-like protein
MVQYFKNILAGATAMVLVASPVALSLQIADSQSVHVQTHKAQVLADEVVRRADGTGRQVREAVVALAALENGPACSRGEIDLMRKLQISASYLQGVGRMRGNRLVCSSHGDHGVGFDLGPADFRSDIGTSVRISSTLPLAPRLPFVILETESIAAIVHPGLLFDVPEYNADITLGLVGHSSGRLVAIRGEGATLFTGMPFPVLERGAGASVLTADGIIAKRRSRQFDLTAIAVIAPHAIATTSSKMKTWMVPIGLMVGLLLAWAFYFLLQRQVSIPALLRAALRRDEFFIVYQPVVRLDNRRCIGAEALLRWRRQDGSMVGPDLFIPIAEATGLIGSITRRMLDLVGADLAAMVALSPQVRVSVNLAPQDLGCSTIVASLQKMLARSGVKAGNLVVEATERGLIDVTLATSVIRDIQAAGIRVAIDDFGTGYSCLSYLDNLRVDYLKIDKSFIDSVGTAAPTNSVVGHIIEMAKSLDLGMVAEGVETEAQAEFLRQRGVQFAQGWLFAKPMRAAEFLRYLAAQASVDPLPCEPASPAAAVAPAAVASAVC